MYRRQFPEGNRDAMRVQSPLEVLIILYKYPEVNQGAYGLLTIMYISAPALKVCSFCHFQMFLGKLPMFYCHEMYILLHFLEA